MTIGIREFSRNIYKYIKEGEDLIVTAKGNILFKVEFDVTTKEHIKERNNVMTRGKEDKVMTSVATNDMEFCKKHNVRKVGCGCK